MFVKESSYLASRIEAGATVAERPAHGELVHRRDARGTYRCPKCNSGRVAQRRRTVKEQLVAEAGGACHLCGYERCSRALGSTISIRRRRPSASRSAASPVDRQARAEAAKCVLLCANRHMEVEAGIRVATAVSTSLARWRLLLLIGGQLNRQSTFDC